MSKSISRQSRILVYFFVLIVLFSCSSKNIEIKEETSNEEEPFSDTGQNDIDQEDQKRKWVLYKVIYDDSEVEFDYKFDEQGNIIEELASDSNGTRKTTYEYDLYNNQIRSSMYDSNGLLVYEYEFEYEYREDGKISKIKTPGSTEEYIYDENGVLIELRSIRPNDPQHLIVLEYDDKGNRIKQTSYKENGDMIEYAIIDYNKDGNELEETAYNSNGIIYQTKNYEYDEHGYLIKMICENNYSGYKDVSIDEYENDEFGNMTKRISYIVGENNEQLFFNQTIFIYKEVEN